MSTGVVINRVLLAITVFIFAGCSFGALEKGETDSVQPAGTAVGSAPQVMEEMAAEEPKQDEAMSDDLLESFVFTPEEE